MVDILHLVEVLATVVVDMRNLGARISARLEGEEQILGMLQGAVEILGFMRNCLSLFRKE